jgi:sugar transferase (PEP-CTERM system associated)
MLYLALDALVFLAAIYAVSAFSRFSLVPADQLPGKALWFMGAMTVGMVAGGLYEPSSPVVNPGVMVRRLAIAVFTGFALLAATFYIFPALAIDSSLFLSALSLSLAGLAVLHSTKVRLAQSQRQRVLVLGAGTRAAKIASFYEETPGISQRIHIVGYAPLGETAISVGAEQLVSGEQSLPELVRALDVQEIVIGIQDRRGSLPLDALLECKMMGVRVLELSSFFERETGALQLESLNTGWMIHSDGFRGRMLQKRVFDLLTSSVLLVVTLPVMAVAALAIYLESGAPVIYRQERVGQGGKPFVIYKFRSMYTDAEKDGRPQWAAQNDSRITRVGNVIRKLRIDELPQIFNVLKGDMSFVGPRPERPFFVDQLTKDIPYYKYRHNLKPGITGWAQVCFTYGASLEDSAEKLQFDLYYVKNHSLFLDVAVLFKTVQIVLLGKGR